MPPTNQCNKPVDARVVETCRLELAGSLLFSDWLEGHVHLLTVPRCFCCSRYPSVRSETLTTEVVDGVMFAVVNPNWRLLEV